jgi:Rne/Rng family ribonuclease
MSKELVISAASHERRVAILEEGQLVEIYIEREKEFALVGSIYKGKVTRVLPGMQSAFVDIGLDGDAFLYVSDVFENLEDYDHGHSHDQPQASSPNLPAAIGSTVELLPGESLARVTEHHEHHEDAHHVETHHEDAHSVEEHHESHEEIHASEEQSLEAHHDDVQPARLNEHHGDAAEVEERQPESNASAPQNFSPHYNPTQNYPSRGANDRSGQNYGRSGDRGDRGGDFNRGSDRGADRGRGRYGRRGGGRHRGGRPQGGHGGRNLPPSKYASPQGGESRGYDNRGQSRGYDNRRSEAPRNQSSSSSSNVSEEEILLPGESLAKYRGKPVATPPPAPIAEHEEHEQRPTHEEPSPRAIGGLPPSAPGAGGPRRFSGGLPRWLLADASSEAEAAPVSADENIGTAEDASLSAHGANPPRHESSTLSLPGAGLSESESQTTVRSDADLNEDQVAALASEFVEAKHEEATKDLEAAALGDAAVFEEEEVDTEEELDESEEAEEVHSEAVSGLSEEETAEVEAGRAAERAEFAADIAQEHAEHHAAHDTHDEAEHDEIENDHADHETVDHDHAEIVHVEEEVIAAAAGVSSAESGAPIEDDVILLPGETRSPRVAGAPREDFPRDSARIGGNPRSRFQRPYRSGGRDRGGRGGRPDGRGGRPDNRGRDRGRSGGPRFERRGPGGPRHDRGYQGGHGHSSRRPQLISEMLKAGQDVVIQIAKEPLGKKGARITSHVALPGRFLVYMPTVHHTGVSRKIVSAENRSRLRRLVSEAGNAYPGGFIVRTAAGGATDDEIRADIDFLGKTWNEIKQKSEERKAPSLLHRDLNLVERILRDYVSDDFTGIWIDNEEEYGKIVEFVSRFQPKLVNKVKLYTKETPIFEEFGIQHELDKALRAKVWLKSGGYIVINHTEALVAIDVNTGKFVGKGSTRLEDTIVKTNLEAVKEIVRQIRLRDLGGIIVVDFIDMEERRNREKVLGALQQALEEDKAPSKALSFNEFGLVCITRKRTKQALERVLCQPCPYCTGSGMVKSVPTLCYEIQAEARKMASADHEGPNLTIRVNPEIAKALKTRESMLIDELEQNSHKHVIIQSDATLHWEQYDIY